MDLILNNNLVSQQLTSQFHPQHFLVELPFQLKRICLYAICFFTDVQHFQFDFHVVAFNPFTKVTYEIILFESTWSRTNLTTKHPIMNQVISISSLFSASIYYTKFVVNKFNCQGQIEGQREKRYIGNAEVQK